jgi:hypothetical protein
MLPRGERPGDGGAVHRVTGGGPATAQVGLPDLAEDGAPTKAGP